MNLMYYIFVSLITIITPSLFWQTTSNIKANQSMLMYGKGMGQDGPVNPYAGEDCYAQIKNNGREKCFSRFSKMER